MSKQIIDLNKPHYQYQGETIINAKKCTGCGMCVKICPGLVLEMCDRKAVVTRACTCIRCGHCAAVCAFDAITETGTDMKKLTAADFKKTPSPESLQFLFRVRRSVRLYKDKPIAKAELEKILEAARYTATGTNCQGIRCIVITGKERIRELRNAALPILDKLFKRLSFMASLPIGRSLMGERLADRITGIYAIGNDSFQERNLKGDDLMFYNAHALMIMYGEKVDESSAFSCGAALYNASLMAHTMGIGSCFNGFLQGVINNNKKIKEQLGIPKYCKCWGAMTLGYPGVKYNRLTMRKPLEVRWV